MCQRLKGDELRAVATRKLQTHPPLDGPGERAEDIGKR